MSQLAELIIDESEELELLKKNAAFYSDTPVVSLGKSQMYFNVAAKPFIPRGVKWYATTSLIIGLPADETQSSVFKINLTGQVGASSIIPATMRQKKLKPGVYQLYKYKNGFAIKRYEPLEVRESA